MRNIITLTFAQRITEEELDSFLKSVFCQPEASEEQKTEILEEEIEIISFVSKKVKINVRRDIMFNALIREFETTFWKTGNEIEINETRSQLQ